MANTFPMTLTYKKTTVTKRTDLSNEYLSALYVESSTYDSIPCDVYKIGIVDSNGAMMLAYIKSENALSSQYINNTYASNGKICKQEILDAVVSGWYSTMNTNFTPRDS